MSKTCAPADGVVILRTRRTPFVDALDQEFGRGKIWSLRSRLVVPGADQRALGRGAVVTDDVIDERVLQDFQVRGRVDNPADVMVSMLWERGVDFHFPGEHRPWFRSIFSHAGISYAS